ncbi:DUF202 domain-containing protein [Rhodococcus sp. NPDC127528]|uniref:DUF202 domain-containing protein n=1 Tax=unclassified Rhodococcus (in: high G+C Gram-positive bacteria) TaxID=192944 RepID=UPI003634449F
MTAVAEPVHDDPGLQPERTTLSWIRTATVLVADVLLFARVTPGGAVAATAVGVVCLMFPLFVLATARRRHGTRVHRFASGTAAPALRWNLLLTSTVLTLAGGAAVLVLAH